MHRLRSLAGGCSTPASRRSKMIRRRASGAVVHQWAQCVGDLIRIEMMPTHVEMDFIVVEVLGHRAGYGGMKIEHLEPGLREDFLNVLCQCSLMTVEFGLHRRQHDQDFSARSVGCVNG